MDITGTRSSQKWLGQSLKILQNVWYVLFYQFETKGHANIRKSPGRCPAVIRQSSGSHHAVIKLSSGSYLAIIRQLSDSHQAVVKQSSGTHQIVIIWDWKPFQSCPNFWKISQLKQNLSNWGIGEHQRIIEYKWHEINL